MTTILMLGTVMHLCRIPHLTALKQLDPGLEAVGASLKVSRFVAFGRVILPTISRITSYLLTNLQ